MTAAQLPRTQSSSLGGIDIHDVVETIAVVVAFAAILLVEVSSAGRTPTAVVIGVVGMAPATVLTRPWRLPVWMLALGVALPAVAVGIGYLDPLRFAFAKDLAVWAFASMAFLVGAGFARDMVRRLAVSVGMCLVVLVAVAGALRPWFAVHDPSRPIVGTFYWHNQIGILAGAGAVGGLVLALFADRRYRLLGIFTAVLGGAGLVLSSSRASLAITVAVTIVLLAAVTTRREWARVLLLLISVTLALITTTALRWAAGLHGHPVLNQVIGGAAQRPASENVHARFLLWKAAIGVFMEDVVAGRGHGAFLLAAPRHLSDPNALSRWSHNGVLNAAADGGLVFGIPVLVATVVSLLFAARVAVRELRRECPDAGTLVASASILILLPHAMFDFDWIYPLLTGLTGLAVGVLAGSSVRTHPNMRTRMTLPVILTVLVLALGGISAYVVNIWGAQDAAVKAGDRMARRGETAAAIAMVRRHRNALVPNPALDAALLTYAVKGTSTGVRLSNRDLDRALHSTAGLAALDAQARAVRNKALTLVHRDG